jgi:tRNA-modifying protein YgfZ
VTTPAFDDPPDPADNPDPAAGRPSAEDPFVVWTDVRRVDVTGADRLGYLDDVTSQSLRDVPAGQVRGALVLDAHGAPTAMFDVAVLADRVALLAPDPEVASTLVEVLGTRTFLADARFAATDDRLVALRGPGAEPVAQAANLTTRPGTVRPAGELYVIGRDGGALDVFGPADALQPVVGLLTDAGAREGTAADLDTWRIAAGVPAWGVEVTPPHLPEELGLLPTHVHLAKGCYPGQEAVARMWMLGRPRRRLAIVRPAVGVELTPGWSRGEGRRAVTVTSVTPDGRGALAFVPGDATVDAEVADGLTLVALVGADATPPGHDPAMTRRRDRPRG